MSDRGYEIGDVVEVDMTAASLDFGSSEPRWVRAQVAKFDADREMVSVHYLSDDGSTATAMVVSFFIRHVRQLPHLRISNCVRRRRERFR